MLTGSDLILLSLKEEGVKVIFGYPGGAVLPFYDALTKYSFKHVLVRHEQAAALAADGYARVSGEVGVCLATSGPGGTNLVTGIANAYMDSVPIVALTGQVPLPVIGTDAFQEVDITGITQPITKHNYLVEKIEDIPHIIKEAFYIARNGRPGPVHIDFPKDIMSNEVEEFDYSKKVELPGFKGKPRIDPDQIKKAAEAIKKARKPVMLVGHGVVLANAQKEVQALAEKLGMPVAPTLLGLGVLPQTHPQNLGMVGMHGFAHTNFVFHNADLILNIGSRFDDRIIGKVENFGSKAVIIHIDIDEAEIGKIIRTDIPVVGDAKDIASALLEMAESQNYSEWWEQIKKWIDQFPYQKSDEREFTARDAISEIYSKTLGNYVIATDVGQHQMWSAQIYKVKDSRKWLSSGGLGDMGYGVPAAMGAFMAEQGKRPVFCISGDGSFQMNIQELQTIAHEKMNLKIFIMNNGFLGMVRQWQEMFYDRNYSGVSITTPDFVKLAEAYGIRGYRVMNRDEMRNVLSKVINDEGPCLVDCVVKEEDNVFPMVPSGKSLGDTIIS